MNEELFFRDAFTQFLPFPPKQKKKKWERRRIRTRTRTIYRL